MKCDKQIWLENSILEHEKELGSLNELPQIIKDLPDVWKHMLDLELQLRVFKEQLEHYEGMTFEEKLRSMRT